MQPDTGLTSSQKAAMWMIFAVAAFSAMPLIIKESEASTAPFFFNGILGLGASVSCFAVALILCPGLMKKENRAVILRRCLTGAMLLASLSICLDFALFAWSAQYIDIAVVTIVFETWPFFMVFLARYLLKKRYDKITVQTIFLLFVGFIGFAFLTGGQIGFGRGVNASLDNATLFGFALAIIGTIAVSLHTPSTLKWGIDVCAELNKKSAPTDRMLEFSCVVVALALSHAFGGAASLLFAVATAEVPTKELTAWALFSGVLIASAGTIALRRANFLTRNLGINAIWYSMPILALIWLWLFSSIEIARADLFIIGSAAIITANLLLNFKADIRLGYKSLVLALWGCGAIVYLRGSEWQWSGKEYFDLLMVSATVFAIILSFRVTRFVNRTSDEENRMMHIFRRLNLLAMRSKIDPLAVRAMLRVDAPKNSADLKSSYAEVKKHIAAALANAKDTDEERLIADAEADLDALAHSKQQGSNFGELVALFVFAALTVFLALFLRPTAIGYGGFVVESFSALLAAVVIFLFFNILDLHRDRGEAILEKMPDSDGYGVAFRDAHSRRFEQWVSVILCIAIAAAYGFLLWDKWLG